MIASEKSLSAKARATIWYLGLRLLFSGSLIYGAQEHDPGTELASFQIASGFEVNLFASEADGVVKPIQIRFDPQGRMWVIGSTVYPQLEPGQSPNDKVLVLEDRNHDGRCDKTTVFADGLMIPTGIELGDGGVYVGHGTELLFLRDSDDDLKADERRVVLRGFGTGDNHQNINSFLWGPGGELWFCQGLHTFSNVETPWGIVRMNQAGLWRFRPRLKKLEGFYGSVYEPQNPWGYVFTDWGEPIVIAGNNSSSIYAVPGLTSRHTDLAPTLIWKNGQGRKSSGADIVGTKHFPDDWQGTIVTGGYINNAVWALRLVEDGAGFAMEDREPLIKSSGREFRPVDVKFGPDGSLYICDWYNPIIGHYQASFRHPDRDKVHGRIWRVTAKGRPLTTPPNLAGASVEELLNQLRSGDRWTRQFAKRVLADRPADEVVPAVDKWVGQSNPTERALKEALGVLQSHEAVNESLVRRLASATEPGARAYAASAIGRWADRMEDPLSILRPLASDTNPRVRLQAVVASTYVERAESVRIAALAAEGVTDKFLDYAFRQAVFALKPLWAPALKTAEFEISGDGALRDLLLNCGGASEVLGELRGLVAAADKGDPDQKLAHWRILVENGDSSDVIRFCELADSSLRQALFPTAVASVRSRNVPAPKETQVVAKLARDNDPNALRLAGIWRVQELQGHLENLAMDKSSPAEVRAAAISALAGMDLDGAARLASEVAQDGKAAPMWAEVFTALLQRRGGIAAFAKALEGKSAAPEIVEASLRIMNETGRRDEQLIQILTRRTETSHRFTLAEIPELVGAVRSEGKAERGEQVFRRAELGCVTCHAVKGKGGAIGPDLGALGTAQPVDFIIGALLDPQKEVKEGYMGVSITTKEGDEYQGYPLRENPNEIMIRDIVQNSTITIPKGKIAQRRQSGSPMPAGLADALSRQEFLDLVRYLSELGK